VGVALAGRSLPSAAEAVSRAVALPDSLGGGSAPVWTLLVVVVLFGTLTPFAAVTLALRRLPATLVSIIGTGEVVGAALIAWWWFGQSLTSVQILGFALVVAGVVLALLARRDPGPTPAATLVV
jgi:drug/metabolite transporter (DMT)-like permease